MLQQHKRWCLDFGFGALEIAFRPGVHTAPTIAVCVDTETCVASQIDAVIVALCEAKAMMLAQQEHNDARSRSAPDV